jgi:hypothetical protein
MPESHPVQQSPDMNRSVEFVGGAFRNTTLYLGRGNRRPINHHPSASWNPTTATFIQAELVAPTPPTDTLLHLPLETSPAKPVKEENGRTGRSSARSDRTTQRGGAPASSQRAAMKDLRQHPHSTCIAPLTTLLTRRRPLELASPHPPSKKGQTHI